MGFVATVMDQTLARWLLCFVGIGLFFVANKYPYLTWAKIFGVKHSPRTALREPRDMGSLMLFRQMVGEVSRIAITQTIDCRQCYVDCVRVKVISGVAMKAHASFAELRGSCPGELRQYPPCKLCKGTGHAHGHYENRCNVCRGYGRRIPEFVKASNEFRSMQSSDSYHAPPKCKCGNPEGEFCVSSSRIPKTLGI